MSKAAIFPAALTLLPRQGARGVVPLPGSKSISNRMLLLAALAKGTTRLTGLLHSDDTTVMIDALRQFGVEIQWNGSPQEACVISGVNGSFPKTGSLAEPIRLFVGNSGLSIRTLVPAIAAVLSARGGCVELSGVPRMHERPIGDLVNGLRAIGAQIDYLQQDGFPPLRIRSAPLFSDREILVKGNTSSQFLTGLLQAAPLMAQQAQDTIVLHVQGELISQPYVDITIATLSRFGIQVTRGQQADDLLFRVAPQIITAPAHALAVEGDASSASYFLAAGLLGGGPVRVVGAGKDSVQGDVQFAHALAEMGAQITWGPDWIEACNPRISEQRSADGAVSGDAQAVPAAIPGIRGVDLDCNAIPDAAMTLAVVALFADRPTTLRNIGSWRVKETDRIAAMAAECQKFGARVEEGPDWLKIHPIWLSQSASDQQATTARCPEIQTYEDHRVAMCFSLASFGRYPVTILDPGCVAKTFPTYFDVFSDICAQAVPVIAIDGPTASGKGTIASMVAEKLGFTYLDSGAMYRLAALAAKRAGQEGPGLDPGKNAGPDGERGDKEYEQALTSIATQMQIRFSAQQIFLDEEEVSEAIRAEEIGLLASKIAVYPGLRHALLKRQREFARLPGLVADGRDMGSVVFPQARLKVFLTAGARERAERRYKQLIAKGFSCNLDSLFADLEARDARDASRAIAPLKPAPGSLVIDSTGRSIDQVVQLVLHAWETENAGPVS
jgi:3-phosphoshikimate 1-carboxyvinyltransferase